MKTKYKDNNKEKDDLETNHSFSIPKNIQESINERGFYLYEWIGEKDVKLSIERDFLKLIRILGIPLSIILLLPSIVLVLMGLIIFAGFYFFLVLLFVNLFLLAYLIFLAIKRSNILRKNAYILVTDSSVSLNGKIEKLKDNKIIIDTETKSIGKLFEEDLFKESNISKTKKGFLDQVIKQLSIGFKGILKLGNKSGRDGLKLVLVLFVLYCIYAFSLGLIYFIGIFFVWIFGNILSIINKRLMLISGHEITTINSYFEDINKGSNKLILGKDKLSLLLKDAIKNDWKDSLLLKINSGIENINKHASTSVEKSIGLKSKIKSSKYKEMFNFTIYNSWIKKQILTPLEQIVLLLQNNLTLLNEKKEYIGNQIEETKDPRLSGSLVAAKKRVEIRINELEQHIEKMKIYIFKLK